MWSGSISFGLVNIPVELHGAVKDHRPRFRMLHAKDESPVHYQRDPVRTIRTAVEGSDVTISNNLVYANGLRGIWLDGSNTTGGSAFSTGSCETPYSRM